MTHCISWNKDFFDKLDKIEQIFIIGHSLGDVDLPYFKKIFDTAPNHVHWNLYYYDPKEENILKNKLISIGIDKENISSYPTSKFYDI